MVLGRLLRPSNRRARLLVGLLLAGLFCIQCTTSEPFRSSSSLVFALSGNEAGKDASRQQADLEALARADHVALLRRCLENYRRGVRDYRCTFIKQERIRGVLGKEQWMEARFLDEPFSVGLKWTRNIPIGEAVLYVEGKYDNHMLVKPKGMLAKIIGTAKRKPDSPDVMQNTLRPVSEFGFEKATENLLSVYELARQRGESKESFGGYAEVAGRKALVLVRYLPQKDEYPAYKTATFIDTELLLPLCIEGYDEQGQLECRYLYKDLELNVGLTEADFLPDVYGMKAPD